MSFNLGFIGGGQMSTAVVNGILKHEKHPPCKIWVSGPRLGNLRHFVEMGVKVTTKNGEVFEECDVIFLGVKPGILTKAVDDMVSTCNRELCHRTVLIVSMLAGVTIEDLQKCLFQYFPNTHVIRTMPNTPMTVGKGVCLYSPDSSVTKDECNLIEDLLKSCGICNQIPEAYMDSLGTLTACGPAFMYVILEALADGAVKQGIPRVEAVKLAAHMVIGSAHMILETGKHPGLLKDEVCSPGGSTIYGIAELEEGKIRGTLIKAIEASSLRTKELGKK